MLKVAYDHQIFSLQRYGGISRYYYEIVKGLIKKRGVAPKIFSQFYVNEYIAGLDAQYIDGFNVSNIRGMSALRYRINDRICKRKITSYKPNVIHQTYYSKVEGLPVGTPKVVTVHDMIHEKFSHQFSNSDKITMQKYEAIKTADHVICISQNTKNDLIDIFNVSPNKLSVIYHGFNSLTEVEGKVYEFSNSKPYILYVGDRFGYKNFKNFLHAYSSSNWLVNNFDVVCFGGSEFNSGELKGIEQLELSNKIQRVSGPDALLADCYKGASLFVYPSLYEGFGMPLLEAMSLGCPVACSGTSSMPEVVGGAGAYFDPSSIDSMREQIEVVLNSSERRAELVAKGNNRFRAFDWSDSAAQTLQVYEGLV